MSKKKQYNERVSKYLVAREGHSWATENKDDPCLKALSTILYTQGNTGQRIA